jgi:O-methyltransferase involved in polyketide biosynthesis
MTRTDDDAWDLASSVGATATMVAAARAMATKTERPLINDPFAEPLVRAVGVDLFTRLVSGELTLDDLHDDDDATSAGMRRMTDNMAVRTKFFDDFFIDATQAGIRHGWQISGNSLRQLFAANGLPPLEDDFPFADRLYVSGTLTDEK